MISKTILPFTQTPSLENERRRQFMQSTALSAALVASAPLLSFPARASDLGMSDSEEEAATNASSDDYLNYFREALIIALSRVPEVGGILSAVAAFLIPTAGKTAEEKWRELISTMISDALFNEVKAILAGLSDLATDYRNAIDSKDKARIKSRSDAIESHFTRDIRKFMTSGEEIRRLPMFAIAATMHLSILRDMALKGADIGFNAESIKEFKTKLRDRIRLYTEHADKFVAAAIEKARKDNPYKSPANRNQPLSAMLSTQAKLQISVLDFRESWQAFDADRNPSRAKVQLIREIYSPIIGWWGGVNQRAPNEIPNWTHPVSRLERLEIYSRSQSRMPYIYGFYMKYASVSGRISDYLRDLKVGKYVGEKSVIHFDRRHTIGDVTGYHSKALVNASIRLSGGGGARRYGAPQQSSHSQFVAGYKGHCLSSIRSTGEADNGSTDGAMSGCVLGFQLIDQESSKISVGAFEIMAPNLPTHLLDWIAS